MHKYKQFKQWNLIESTKHILPGKLTEVIPAKPIKGNKEELWGATRSEHFQTQNAARGNQRQHPHRPHGSGKEHALKAVTPLKI